METGKIDRRKLMDDVKLERLRKAREKKEENRLKRETDKNDVIKKKIIDEMYNQEVNLAEKQRLKEEKWNRRKAELLEEFKKLGANTRASSFITERSEPIKTSRPSEPNSSEDESDDKDAICLF